MRAPALAAVALWLTALSPGLLAASMKEASMKEAAPAATGAPATRPAQTADHARATLQLVDQQFAIDPNGDIRLDYLLTGLVGDPLELVPPPPPPPPPEPPSAPADPAAPPPPPTLPPAPTPPPVVVEPEPPVTLTVEITNYEALTDPAVVPEVVGAGLDPEAAGVVGRAIDGVALDARPLLVRNDDGTVALSLVVGTDGADSVRERLKLERPGLYPVRVQLLIGDPADDNVVATASTVVQRLAGAVDVGINAAPPIDLSVIAATPPAAPNATADELDAARAELDQSIEQAAEIDAPLTIEVAPTLIAELAATPEGADRLATALADDELVALPLVPLDVSAAVAVGWGDSYTRLVRAGEDLLTAAAPTVPSVRSVWITTDELSGAGAQHLRDLGARVVIMTADLYTRNIDDVPPSTDRLVEASLPEGGTIALLVVDPLSEELTEAAADRILADATAIEWGVATLAQMLMEQTVDDIASDAGTPRRSRVLTTPQLRTPDPRLLDSLEHLAATTTAVRFIPASDLIGVTDVLVADGEPVTVRFPDTAGPSLAARVDRLDLTSTTMESVATMLSDGDPRPPQWKDRIELLISTAYSDAEVEAATDELLAEAAALQDAVQLPDPFTFTLTGRSGTIEVRIANTADEPLDVLVELTSPKVEFPDGPQRVTLRPLDETSVVVPVEAQSNGTSSIALRVSTPSGEPLGGVVNLTARVTALTGLGQVLTGGLIAVILTWWFSHWRSRRRAAVLDGRGRHPSGGELESETL